MAVVLDLVSDRKSKKLKNQKLQPIRKEAAKCTGEPKCAEEGLENLLSSTFTLPVFFSLLPHELANLEAACGCLRRAMNGENTGLIWVASAYAASRGRRVLLPVQAFASMPLPQIKYTLANMKYARGFMHGRAVPLSDGVEFNAVLSSCDHAAAHKVAVPNSSIRVVVGRARFRQQGSMFTRMLGDEGDDTGDFEGDDDNVYVSSEMGFCWTGQGSHGKGTMLVASLVLLNGAAVLEVSSVIKPLRSPIVLSVDLRLVNPLLPKGLVAEGIKVNVDGSCSGFELPGLDITDEQTRAAFKSSDGVLCILVARNLMPGTQEVRSPPALSKEMIAQSKTAPIPQALVASSFARRFFSFGFTLIGKELS